MGKTKINTIGTEPSSAKATEGRRKKTYEEKRAEKAALGVLSEEKTKKGIAAEQKAPRNNVIANEVKQSQDEIATSSTTPRNDKSASESTQLPTTNSLILGANRGKKYKVARAKVENKAYKLNDAVKLVCETSYSSFPGSIELHLVLNEGTVNNRVELPYSTGTVKRIEIADDKTIEKLKTGKIDFDVLLTTPSMMPKLVPFAKFLGPRGLMPNPKNGTVVENPEKAKSAFGGNSVTIKTEKSAPLIHLVVAKTTQDEKEIAENIQAIITNVGEKRIKKAVASASMGPGVQIQVA